MASSGPNSAGTGANIAGANTDWSNPTRIVSDNGSYATCSLAAGASSDLLAATQFGFAIDSGATIDGLVFEVECFDGFGDGIEVSDLFPTKNGSATVGTDQSAGDELPAADGTYLSFGGSADLCGTTWTPAEVNASTFGCLFRVLNSDPGSAVASVDHIRCTVYYTLAATTGPKMHQYRIRRAVY